MSAVGDNLWECAICIATSKLIHEGLIICGARPCEAGVAGNVVSVFLNNQLGFLFLCTQLVEFKTTSLTAALVIWKLLCKADSQQTQTPKSLRDKHNFRCEKRCTFQLATQNRTPRTMIQPIQSQSISRSKLIIQGRATWK